MFLDELATVLENAGVAQRHVNLFYTSAAVPPQGDGPFVSLIPTTGGPPVFMHDKTTVAYQQSRCQVVTRGADAIQVVAKAYDAYNALVLHDVDIEGVPYVRLRPMQEPFDLPPDEHRRARLVFNVEAYKRPS